EERCVGNGRFIEVTGARENNLQNITARFPLGKFIAVTGVSGSGKSTLINSILKKAIAQKLNRNSDKPGKFKTISGIEHIDRLIDIDQSPIGRTPRSNPATYTGVFDDIRDLFAQTNEAKIRGYKKGRFSFNVKGGRCEACSGDG
ncbi:ATP-binding cassette domain-containing protein, partial [Streptococcus pneumoniae]|uniref:ATP-binding cassette domain-containing protein n=1 Tax=Streptococcus pneumoniae TaxID=1313 RepID=UPI0012D7918D